MNTTPAATTAAYLEAWKKLDMDGVFRHVHPDVTYVGALQKLEGKAAIRDYFDAFARMVDTVVVRAHAVEGDHALIAFDFHCRPPVGIGRVAEMLTFNAGLIASIEHFFDPRPFLQNG